MDCNDSATVRLTRSTLRSTSSFFSSSAMLRHRASAASLIIETTQTKPAIETTKTNNSREPRARASCKHFATVHPARHRAPAPHRSIRIEQLYNNTKSILQQFTRPLSVYYKRLQNALDSRRNASLKTNCGRLLLRPISRHLYINIIP